MLKDFEISSESKLLLFMSKNEVHLAWAQDLSVFLNVIFSLSSDVAIMSFSCLFLDTVKFLYFLYFIVASWLGSWLPFFSILLTIVVENNIFFVTYVSLIIYWCGKVKVFLMVIMSIQSFSILVNSEWTLSISIW